MFPRQVSVFIHTHTTSTRTPHHRGFREPLFALSVPPSIVGLAWATVSSSPVRLCELNLFSLSHPALDAALLSSPALGNAQAEEKNPGVVHELIDAILESEQAKGEPLSAPCAPHHARAHPLPPSTPARHHHSPAIV